jgi:hypothetical protein
MGRWFSSGMLFAVFQTKQVFGELFPGIVTFPGGCGLIEVRHLRKLPVAHRICKRSKFQDAALLLAAGST